MSALVGLGLVYLGLEGLNRLVWNIWVTPVLENVALEASGTEQAWRDDLVALDFLSSSRRSDAGPYLRAVPPVPSDEQELSVEATDWFADLGAFDLWVLHREDPDARFLEATLEPVVGFIDWAKRRLEFHEQRPDAVAEVRHLALILVRSEDLLTALAGVSILRAELSHREAHGCEVAGVREVSEAELQALDRALRAAPMMLGPHVGLDVFERSVELARGHPIFCVGVTEASLLAGTLHGLSRGDQSARFERVRALVEDGDCVFEVARRRWKDVAALPDVAGEDATLLWELGRLPPIASLAAGLLEVVGLQDGFRGYREEALQPPLNPSAR